MIRRAGLLLSVLLAVGGLAIPAASAAPPQSRVVSPLTVTCPPSGCGGYVVGTNGYFNSTGTETFGTMFGDYLPGFGSYSFNFSQTATENSSSSITSGEGYMSGGTTTAAAAGWGPYWVFSNNASYDFVLQICTPIADPYGINLGKTLTGLGSSNPMVADQYVYVSYSGAACPSDPVAPGVASIENRWYLNPR